MHITVYNIIKGGNKKLKYSTQKNISYTLNIGVSQK
jgi:hypothetical protein